MAAGSPYFPQEPLVDAVIPIARLLADTGLVTPEAQAQARTLLEQHGLTSPRKQQIAMVKVDRARALLTEHLRITCDNAECMTLAADTWPGKAPLIGAPAHCAICGGSSQRRAARFLAVALGRVGISRVLLLGGTPPQHATLRELLAADPIALRTVDGSTRGHSAAEAAPHVAWAQLLVIWASTPLHHKVSVAYTSQAPATLSVITVTRRGVESLCRGIIAEVERPRSR